MKKLTSLLFVLVFTTSFAFSQTAVQEGDKIISLNIGFPPTFGWGKMKVPVISANLDWLIKKAGPGTIGVGGLLGFAVTEDNFSQFFPDEYYRYTYLLFGARGTYHWFPGTSDKIDTYAGVSLGFKIVSEKYHGAAATPTISANGSGAFGGPFVGIRYLFNPNIGVNAELGYGVSILTLGGSFKF